jgi:large subunit ribosomal protein L22
MATDKAAKKAIARDRHMRITPNKLRAVANLIRGKKVEVAIDTLRYCPRRGAKSILKVVQSALANADVQGGLDVDRLKVSMIRVDEGPSWKRHRPRSRGMAAPLVKRTSHLTVELAEG